MWWRIPIEVALAVVTAVLASSFWSFAKSQTFIGRTLRDTTELLRLIESIGRDNLIRESSQRRPVRGSWLKDIDFNSEVHFRALARTRRLLVLGTAVVIIVSYLSLGPVYAGINLSLFLLFALAPISAPARNHDLSLVHGILLDLFSWWREDPEGASKQCPTSLAGALFLLINLADAEQAAGQPNARRGRAPRIEPYTLGMRTEGIPGLVELSADERKALNPGVEFRNERICHAPPGTLGGVQWDVILGSVDGVVYKISAEATGGEPAQRHRVGLKIRNLLQTELGAPNSSQPTFWIWDTEDGNVILNFADAGGVYAVVMTMTSQEASGFVRVTRT